MVQIGQVQVLLESRDVRIHGESINLGSRAFCILEILVRARGNLVSKEEIMRRVWPDTVVEENNLQVQIGTLRKLLGADRKLIRTVPGRGYLLLLASGVSADSIQPITSPAPNAADNSELIGRQSSIREIAALLRKARLVTLLGAGGIGKTSLARKVASEVAALFPAGVVFASLENVTSSSLVAEAVSTALGMQALLEPVSIKHIAAWTVGKQMLLILDNCEHVIDAAAELAETLASNSPQISVLATSREALRTQGETLYRVPALNTPWEGSRAQEALQTSAVQLFLSRVRSVDPKFPSHEKSLALVSLVCRQLDGIPLAIELAAARAATLGIEVLAEHLHDRFHILGGGRRTVPPRHKTLAATFDWSYCLLDELERILFRRLGIFVNGFSFHAALHAMEDHRTTHAEILHALSGLISKSLVVHHSANASRYSLLESTRAYALQQLDDHGERNSASLKHAAHVLDLFNRARHDRGGRPFESWQKTLRSEMGNLRAALDWAFSADGNVQMGVDLSVAAVPYLYEISHVGECAERAMTALHAVRALKDSTSRESATLPLLSSYAAALTYAHGPNEAVWNTWTEVMSLAVANRDTDAESRALWGLWNVRQLAGNAQDALAQARRFSSFAERSGNANLSTLALHAEGIAMHYVGDQRAARERLESMLGSYSVTHHRRGATGFETDHGIAARATLARVLWLQGDILAALRLSKEAIDAALTYGSDMMTCYVLVEAVVPLALLCADHALAAQGISVLRTQSRRTGFAIWSVCCDAYDEYRKSMADDAELRLSSFRAAIEALRRVQFLAPLPLLLGRLARALLATGRICEALNAVNEALWHCEKAGNRWYYAELCRIRAEVAQASGCNDEVEAWLLSAVKHANQQGAYGLARTAAESLLDLRPSGVGPQPVPMQKSATAITARSQPRDIGPADYALSSNAICPAPSQ
jgi:predicted ATPase/DNA-binding winged helix-turn-helix (wHTH) protein